MNDAARVDTIRLAQPCPSCGASEARRLLEWKRGFCTSDAWLCECGELIYEWQQNREGANGERFDVAP